MLSGAFAILSKALSLGCLPRVQVIHTSKKYEGQVYIPEVNFLMGLASIIVTIAFRTTTSIGNAYGKDWIVLVFFFFLKNTRKSTGGAVSSIFQKTVCLMMHLILTLAVL